MTLGTEILLEQIDAMRKIMLVDDGMTVAALQLGLRMQGKVRDIEQESHMAG